MADNRFSIMNLFNQGGKENKPSQNTQAGGGGAELPPKPPPTKSILKTSVKVA